MAEVDLFETLRRWATDRRTSTPISSTLQSRSFLSLPPGKRAGETSHWVETLHGWVLLYVHRNRRLIRDWSPGRPPRLSHSSWALKCMSSILIFFSGAVSSDVTIFYLPLIFRDFNRCGRMKPCASVTPCPYILFWPARIRPYKATVVVVFVKIIH